MPQGFFFEHSLLFSLMISFLFEGEYRGGHVIYFIRDDIVYSYDIVLLTITGRQNNTSKYILRIILLLHRIANRVVIFVHIYTKFLSCANFTYIYIPCTCTD